MADQPATESKFWINMAYQVTAAVVVLVAVYFMARWVLKGDLVRIQGEAEPRTSVVVVPGTKSTRGEESVFLTTVAAGALNKREEFVYLPPSLNTDGGAQFTYSFWIKVDKKNSKPFDTVIFLRGDTTRDTFRNASPDASDKIKHPTAFCPMVRAKMDADHTFTLTAQVNTSSEFNNVTTHVIKNGGPNDLTDYHLVCVSCSDGEIHGTERGMVCRVWFDQVPVERFFKGEALRENGGNLYVAPDFKEADGSGNNVFPNNKHKSESGAGQATIRNLTYHNFAVNSDEVFDLLVNESAIVNRQYVAPVEAGNNGYMHRALRLQEQHNW